MVQKAPVPEDLGVSPTAMKAMSGYKAIGSLNASHEWGKSKHPRKPRVLRPVKDKVKTVLDFDTCSFLKRPLVTTKSARKSSNKSESYSLRE